MTFHRRCTLFFLDLFSILALIALGVEILGPWMLEEGNKCYSIAFECSTCPTLSTKGSELKCGFAIQAHEKDKYFLTTLITASIAGCIVAIMTVLAVIMSCCSCSASSSCSHSMYRFTLAYILLDVLALIANIVAMALWVVMKTKEKFGPSFWVGWAANALLLILLMILICLRTRGGKGEGYEEYKSQTSTDQSLFRSLYQMTPTTVFHE
ncbi:hypothetical protein TSMEX_007104 [Taenia solium]|eukprot:TsM_000728500 transcript=TsM_000728500 gene=TsM_000728500